MRFLVDIKVEFPEKQLNIEFREEVQDVDVNLIIVTKEIVTKFG